ncbi:hypothetical protein VU13_04815, partial [Desulfobulbus sp. US5]|nr:hypothetical protein [Desulfobulbus sp. US5]
MMKSNTRLLHSMMAVAATALLLCSCVGKKSEDENSKPARLTAPERKQRTVIEPSLLPQRFQRAGYMINDDEANAMLDSEASDEFQLKVGADITTNEPITLREAMKALIRNKKMSLSWASDVNQDLRVDIDVTADDNFYEAIDNILRQLDYYHEVQGSTLIVKYRQTKQYQIAMPFVKQEYNTAIGGNSFGSDVRIDSKGNTFDIWENIQNNIDSLLSTWSATITNPEEEDSGGDIEKDGEEEETPAKGPSRRVSSTESSYTIDKPVGLITVHAPKSLQKRIANYLGTLERELYKQIIIEAKIIEVQLENNSSLGINWQTLLKNLTFAGGSVSASKYYGKDKEGLYESINSSTNTTLNSVTDTTASGISNELVDENTSGDDPATSSTLTTTGLGENLTENIASNIGEVVAGTGSTIATLVTGG